MLQADDSTTEVENALAAEFRAAVADARARVGALLEPACPDVTFLKALSDELAKAAAEPTSVPYPELIDPDTYWEASVKPQAKSLRDGVLGIVEWLENRVIKTMEVAEADLKQIVDLAAAETESNPEATRREISDCIATRCTALHHQMAELLDVLPDRAALDEARAAHDEALVRRATTDVEGLRDAYLRDAGGDDAHQAFAAQQWSETFADRVAHRQALLAGAAPWRHQELALVGYERARAESESLVEAAVARLQSPLGSMQQLLMERYDNAGS